MPASRLLSGLQTRETPDHDPQEDDPTGAAGEGRADEEQLLLQFVRDRDAYCPTCGYNVRNLTRSVCPECDARLQLRIDLRRARIGWLVVAMAPSIFSGICGILLLALILIFPGEEWQVWVLDAFGLLSGAAGLALFLLRDRFIRLEWRAQAFCAILTWLIHLAAFATLVALAPS